jgi:hypothetical protein
MIAHNLMIRLKDRSPKSIEETRLVISGMDGKIEVIKSISVKTDYRGPEAAPFDLMMVARFESPGDLEIYLKHPAHVEVGAHVGEAAEQVIGFRYEE